MKWAGHVAHMDEERGVYKVLVGKKAMLLWKLRTTGYESTHTTRQAIVIVTAIMFSINPTGSTVMRMCKWPHSTNNNYIGYKCICYNLNIFLYYKMR